MKKHMSNVSKYKHGIQGYDYDYNYNKHTRIRKVPESESQSFPLQALMVQTNNVELLAGLI